MSPDIATSSVPPGTVGVFIFHGDKGGVLWLGGAWVRAASIGINTANFSRIVLWGCNTGEAAWVISLSTNAPVYGTAARVLALEPLQGLFYPPFY